MNPDLTATMRKLWSVMSWFWWFWAVLALSYILIGTGFAILGGKPDISIWATSMNSTRGTMGALGVLVTPVFLPMFVAAGVTRRMVSSAVLIVIMGMATISAALMTIGYVVERVIYDSVGLEQTMQGSHLFDTPAQYHLIFTETLLLQLAYFMCGWLVGACFYRFGAIAGLLCVLPAALPAVACELLTTGSPLFGVPTRLVPEMTGSKGVTVLTVAAVVAVTYGVVRRVNAAVPIKPRTV